MRAGLTLIEILVSIMIFSVMSVAMLSTFTVSSSLFREGEGARAAADGAIGVVSTLDGDLRRLVPAAAGGFFYLGQHAVAGHDPGGSTVLGFTALNRDPALTVVENGVTRMAGIVLVLWWTDATGRLQRAAQPARRSDTNFNAINGMFAGGGNVVADGCLLFSATATIADLGSDRSLPGPTLDEFICTEEALRPAGSADPFPLGLDVTIVLTAGGRDANAIFQAGRNSARGRLARDLEAGDSEMLVSGLRRLPTGPGVMLRLGDAEGGSGADEGARTLEWVGYERMTGSRVFGLVRGLQRTSAHAHPRDTPVRYGRIYSITRALPQ